MKVVVLGGNGFIGQSICKTLSNSKHIVYSFDRNRCKNLEINCTSIVGDFHRDEDLFQAVEGADCVLHAISSFATNNSQTQYLNAYIGDVSQSVKLFEYVSQRHIKTLFLSSGGTVYGDPKKIPTNEDEPTNPISHYGVIKRTIEAAAEVFNRTYGNNIFCLRLSNPYGPGQNFTKGIGFVDAALRCAVSGKTLSIWGDGTIIRDYIYIEDVVKIVLYIIENDIPYSILNVGSGVGTSQNEIVECVRSMGLNLQVEYLPSRQFDVKSNILDISKMLSLSNFTITPFSQGINKYYSYLKDNLKKEFYGD